MNSNVISAEFTRFTELRRRLIEADPEIDETTLLDTLEGATSLHEAIGQVLREALAEEAMADGLKARVAQMRERLERIETTSAKKREVAQAVMEEAGIEKSGASQRWRSVLGAGECTLSRRQPSKLFWGLTPIDAQQAPPCLETSRQLRR